jgi:Zn-dependent protease with chaperone function
MSTVAEAHRTPQESTRFLVAMCIAIPTWLVLLVALNVYIPCVGAFVLVAHALFLASVTGNAVRLSEEQLPDLHRRVVRASEKLGLDKPPDAYVIQAGGMLNAFATRLLSRNYIVLYSDLVDAGSSDGEKPADEPDAVEFVVAHEVGHLALGHLKWNFFLAPIRFLPWIGPAYSRACEYSCDRCGHAVVGDLDISSRALAMLAAGGKLARRVNMDAFVAQRQEASRFWTAVYELTSTHPLLAKRVAALRELAQPGSTPQPTRPALAYLVAPLASAGTWALVYMVFVIGMLAAIAIPNFIAMQLKAKRGEVPGNVVGIAAAELAYEAANGTFLACGSAADAARAGKEPRDWAGEPAAVCFEKLGWQPGGAVRGVYWVEVGVDESGAPAFAVHGVSDVDGDGQLAEYVGWADGNSAQLTEDAVY